MKESKSLLPKEESRVFSLSDEKRMPAPELSGEHAVVFYDGVCGFCQRIVQFILPRDPGGYFRFAALQSDTARQLLASYGIDSERLDTFVLVEKGRAYTRSTAGLRVVRKLGGAWKWLYIFMLVPRLWRDAVYQYIAGHRYEWFGRSHACMLPSCKVRERFLDM